MTKPLIGITPVHNLENDDIAQRPTYLRAIAASGGIPILLPLEGTAEDWAQLTSVCDGLLFSGGPDLHPFLFGEDTHAACGNVSAARDRMELALLPMAMKAKKPILGICRGIQLINVGLGGTIYQDIPSQVTSDFPLAHRQTHAYRLPSHHVSVKEGSLLSRITGGSPQLAVNSMHHQSVRQPAPGLEVTAWAADGVIEAVEKPDYPFLVGVQWHPEYLWQDDKQAAALFKAFVDACR